MLKRSWAVRIADCRSSVGRRCRVPDPLPSSREQAAAAIAGAEAMATEAMQTANQALVAVDELRAAVDEANAERPGSSVSIRGSCSSGRSGGRGGTGSCGQG